jgi:hypothetical protein
MNLILEMVFQNLSKGLGGWMIARGVATSDQAQAIVGGIVAALAVGWHLWSAFRAKTAQTAAAAATSQATSAIPIKTIVPMLLLTAGFLVAGCTSTQQRVAFNTLYSVEQTTTAALNSYDTLVIKGSVPTNDVPRISAAYNTFQAAFLVALDAAQFNTNAIAPPALIVEGQDVVNLITTIQNK